MAVPAAIVEEHHGRRRGCVVASLGDDVADLVVQLAVFTGAWTLGVAEAICDDGTSVVDRLDALVACSLVEVTDDPASTRFWMLEPVRRFAARLQAHPRHARLRDRHLDSWVQHATGATT